jgi:hypothetical protein
VPLWRLELTAAFVPALRSNLQSFIGLAAGSRSNRSRKNGLVMAMLRSPSTMG